MNQFVAIVIVAIGLLLAPNTKWSPWDRSQPPWTDFLFAMDTHSKRTIFNPTKSRSHISQQFRVRSVLHFIQRICALLDNTFIPIANDLFQLRLPALREAS